jgi:hypothetical protein
MSPRQSVLPWAPCRGVTAGDDADDAVDNPITFSAFTVNV